MRSEEKIVAPGQPADIRDGGAVDDSIFVEARVLLRDGLVPEYVPRVEADDDVEVGGGFGDLVYVVAKGVGFGEEDLCEVFDLRILSAPILRLRNHLMIGRGRPPTLFA